MFVPLALAAAAAALVAACPDGHDHEHDAREPHVHRRAFPSAPLTPPSRPLQWGDVNIIHTTDSHGWLLGHQKASFPEPNYSADFGDFASFVTHMKAIAEEKDVDLLLVDSGDLHDGTGLSDGFPPGGVDAHDVSPSVFARHAGAMGPRADVASPSHELYIYNNTLDMYKNFAPKFHGRYLSSNVNITVLDKHGNNVSVPVGSRFARFETTKGRKVTALGVLFDFTGNDAGTTVQPVADMVKEAWFAEAIQEEPDFFLLVGHMPVARDNWPLVFNAIRAVHSTTPILILGGHSHVRDCLQLDGRSMSLESGRYMETVGWLSANLEHAGRTRNITFSRRYLDPNRVTFEYHTRRSNATFDTASGKAITKGLNNLAQQFDLSLTYGTAPQDYTLSRDPYPSNGSLLSLFADQVMPVGLAVNNTRAASGIPAFFFINSGSFRFDIYAGAFTKNDQLTASPFTDSFLFLPNVTLDAANAVVAALNGGSTASRRELEEEDVLYSRGDVSKRYNEWLRAMYEAEPLAKRAAANLTLGYVTEDACPGVGDDTLHTALPFFSTPAYVASPAPAGVASNAAVLDFVFDDYIVSDVVRILNSVQSATTYTASEAALYSETLLDEVLGVFAQAEWK
ncbi:Metallo-dependent phosphatase-like protein [Vararia minispora EC-137]|uniref:Metallo-dependent phosphatase-like protein n=1 Tax=Vararia minispora EC-137 TaxID=1314806 RepID=A0ACB8QJX2_9AGAM|nr:Metallo-dependent phosphatase-like protein [Vararia minispora EC-137]